MNVNIGNLKKKKKKKRILFIFRWWQIIYDMMVMKAG